MNNRITEYLQISLIILSLTIGIAMPNISIVPVGYDSTFAFWFMFIGLIIPISLGILLCIQTFSEKPQTV